MVGDQRRGASLLGSGEKPFTDAGNVSIWNSVRQTHKYLASDCEVSPEIGGLKYAAYQLADQFRTPGRHDTVDEAGHERFVVAGNRVMNRIAPLPQVDALRCE